MSAFDKYYDHLVMGIHLGITAPDAECSAIVWPKVLEISRKLTARDMGCAFQTALLRYKEHGSIENYHEHLNKDNS